MTDTLAAGILLLATPWLKDPPFDRAVVLLCTHGDSGTLGLVLNRPLEVTAGEGLAGVVAPQRVTMPLFNGGPVSPDSLYALHTMDTLRGPSEMVCGNVGFLPGTGELLNVLQAPPAEGEALRLFAGCAGWAPGQLEAEIANNAWILAPSSPRAIFTGKPESLWGRVMRSLGPYNTFLARMPADLRFN